MADGQSFRGFVHARVRAERKRYRSTVNLCALRWELELAKRLDEKKANSSECVIHDDTITRCRIWSSRGSIAFTDTPSAGLDCLFEMPTMEAHKSTLEMIQYRAWHVHGVMTVKAGGTRNARYWSDAHVEVQVGFPEEPLIPKKEVV